MNNDLVKDVPDSSGVITRYSPGGFEQVHHEGSSALNPVLSECDRHIRFTVEIYGFDIT